MPWFTNKRTRFEHYFTTYIEALDTAPRLKAAISHSALNGGKRLRALLAISAGHISDSDEATLFPIATAIEFIHCYSLIHDDLPAMDNDAMRRGKPSCHIAFDEATAILAGDALLTESFLLLANTPNLTDTTRIELIKILSQASGPTGMVHGQFLDMAAEHIEVSLEALQTIHQLKTGALIGASVLMGYRSGPHYEAQYAPIFTQFTQCLGLAFQIQDDILDSVSTSETLGKTAGKDLAQAKATYVSLLGIEKAQHTATTLIDKALGLIAPFGEKAAPLNELAQFTIQRQY